MDQYLERIASALERIADAISHPRITVESPGPTIAAAAAASAAVPAIDTSMPGSEAPAKRTRAKKEQAPAVVAAETPAAPAKEIKMADVAEVVRKLVSSDQTNGHSQAVSVLKTFGANRISEVKEADFPAVIAKINALLSAKK